ncbi:MAG: alcohol dehydrogenase catalytic domain-containing protein [Conexibacteraceae bacterium]|nr:alcohol dehydrogenase catalytic domain-containing protein [Conexibacteraceae bacterium]
MEIRAAVLEGVGEPPLIRPVELDPPGRGEVLVRVGAAGLCHSDLSVIDGSRPRPLPIVLGHEVSGEILAVGAGVSSLTVGDHVVAAFVPSCGDCVECRQGRPALCEPGAAANGSGTLLGGERRLRHADGPPGGTGAPIHHHLGVSGFADHAVLSERSLVRIDPELPWEIAALFGCAVLTGVGAVVNAACVRPGETVAIFGLGGVGLAALLGAVAAGAWPVVAIDRVPAKLELARELGATHAMPAGPEITEQVRALVPGGVDHAIETVGSSEVLAAAYHATRRGGCTTTVGLPHPDARLTIPAVSLTAEQRRLQGSYLGSCVPSRDIPRFIALYRAGRLPVDRLLSHRLGLDELDSGFARLARGDAVRQVVVF